jgi:exoribonuclease R
MLRVGSPAVPLPRLRAPSTAEFHAGFAAIRARLEVPEQVPAEVEAAAVEAARRAVTADRADHRDLELVTIDPPGSRDLDQALHLEARGDGHRVWYAIADVAAFVDPGDLVDQEAWRRVVTRYSPDHRAPLHPTPLSEAAASLLPGEDRPVFLWIVDLDGEGEVTARRVERAVVRSRAQLSYADAQALVDAGEQPSLAALRSMGERRAARQLARGGISLHLPHQEVVPAGLRGPNGEAGLRGPNGETGLRGPNGEANGGYDLVYGAPLPVEQWNEQVSLLTGMVAAELMLAAGTGVLRTLPPPPHWVVVALGRSAKALGVPWPKRADGYPELLSGLDPAVPQQAALIAQAARLFRGAGYEAFHGAPPEVSEQAAIGGPYAHVTAPLRRLGDRFALELALAACEERPPPAWALDALGPLPEALEEGARRQAALDRACVDFVEAMVLRDRVGERFDVVVTEVDEDGCARVQFADPAVLARAEGTGLTAGATAEVEVEGVAPEAGQVRLRSVG